VRYAEAQYGEYATALGEFATGRTITIELYNAATGAVVGLSSVVCTEIGVTGVFRWLTSSITAQPTGYTEFLYVMTDVTPVVGTGRTHKGKIIVGGFPSDSAKRRFQQKVWIDTTSGTTGTDFDKGTPENPVDNVGDARTIANRENLSSYNVNGPITLVVDHENWSFYGVAPDDDIITVQAGVSVAGSEFIRCGIRGNLSGNISGIECLVGIYGQTVTGVQGTFVSTGFDGTIRPDPAGIGIKGLNLAAQNVNVLDPGTILDYNDALCIVIGQFTGIWKIRNIVDPFAIVGISGDGVEIDLDSSIDGGYFYLLGQGELVNNAKSVGEMHDFLLRGSRVDVDTSSRSTQAQILSDATPFAGADVVRILDLLEATSEVDQSTDPWTEVWIRQSDLFVLATFELYDETLAAINAGNPITGKRVRRRLKV
jgi:hypothetical protein